MSESLNPIAVEEIKASSSSTKHYESYNDEKFLHILTECENHILAHRTCSMLAIIIMDYI